MKYTGQAIQCIPLSDGFVELKFDLAGDSVNKFNALTVKELREAVDLLKAEKGLRGVLMTSGKDVFIVGADVTEFLGLFRRPAEEMAAWMAGVNRTFSDLEDLDCPTVAVINGFALGGGFEVCLAASFRVMADDTKVGFPETKLGIFPGWGGTVRFPRLVGADNAIEWIASGEQWSAADALKIRAVDGVVPKESLRDAALGVLRDAAAGTLDWKKRRAAKTGPLELDKVEATMVFETSKAFVGGKAGPNYPSPLAAIEAIEKGARKGRDEALPIETEAFVKIARGPVAASLVSVFLGDQLVKKTAKKAAKAARKVESAAVLGAGIMGGGIAYQSAVKGIPILMKDIAPKAIDLGLAEAGKLLEKQVSRGKMTPAKMAAALGRIRPTLSYGDFGGVDIVVEAVVENEKVKKAVLAEVEALLKEGAVLASNTSTISITRLAESLKRPGDFCGMHFFNPVPKMPLVEVIRGKKSSETAVATAVAWAQTMGKTPVVVNDCPGFLVNRVLFPYFAGFVRLVQDGVDFTRIDKVMERWGWPMGPAYLLDVVGIDTAVHADKVMAAAFPDRMGHTGKTPMEAMFDAERYGQKNGKGFYVYKQEKKGPPKKTPDPEAVALLAPTVTGAAKVTDEEIVERMMLPMLLECSRCLEDRIVENPVEVDIALLYGLGFPPFRGGIFRWADVTGSAALLAATEKHAALGKLYEPTAQLKDLARKGMPFHAGE